MPNLSKYQRHKIFTLFNKGYSVERIAAETGLTVNQINIALWGVKTKIKSHANQS